MGVSPLFFLFHIPYYSIYLSIHQRTVSFFLSVAGKGGLRGCKRNGENVGHPSCLRKPSNSQASPLGWKNITC